MRLSFLKLIQASYACRNVVNGKWITTHYTRKSRNTDPRWQDINMERVTDNHDVIIIGGGPAGLSTAIRLKQLAAESNKG